MFCHNKPLFRARSEGLGRLAHSVYRNRIVSLSRLRQPKRLTNFWETARRSQYQEKEVDLLLTLKTACHNVVVSWQS